MKKNLYMTKITNEVEKLLREWADPDMDNAYYSVMVNGRSGQVKCLMQGDVRYLIQAMVRYSYEDVRVPLLLASVLLSIAANDPGFGAELKNQLEKALNGTAKGCPAAEA